MIRSRIGTAGRARPFSATAGRLQNHYQVLGVSVNASQDTIKKRFYELSKKHHPDANKDASPEKYQQITEAYATLSSDVKRREFNATLGDAARQPGYSSGRRWEGPRRAASGYQFHARARPQAPHGARTDPNLDPLRPSSGNSSVPHFDHSKHFENHLRHEAHMNRRDEERFQAAKNESREATGGTGVFLGSAIVGTCLLYLFIR